MARDPEREARRLARRDRSLRSHANRIAGEELRKRIKHTLDEINRDSEERARTNGKSDGSGAMTGACRDGKHHFCGSYAWPEGQMGDPKPCACTCHGNPVTPPEQNDEHDSNPDQTTD